MKRTTAEANRGPEGRQEIARSVRAGNAMSLHGFVRSGGPTHAPRQVSADRRTAYDVVFLDLSPDDSPQALDGLESRLRSVPGVSVAGSRCHSRTA